MSLPAPPVITTLVPGLNSIRLTISRSSSFNFITCNIEISTNNGPWTLYTSSRSVSVIVSGLNDSSSYRFRVSGTYSAGTTAFSQISNPVSPLGSLPSAPIITKVTNGGDGTNADIVWSRPSYIGTSAITSYVIQSSSDNGISWVDRGTAQVAATLYHRANGLIPGTRYIFRVAAINSAGTGPYGLSNSVMIFGPPPAPSNFRAVFGDARATAYWTPPNNNGSNITKYEISCVGFNDLGTARLYDPNAAGRSPRPVHSFIVNVTNTNNINTSVIQNLRNGIFYALNIRAINSLIGAWSSTFAIRPRGLPSKPTGLTITGQGSSSVTLSWTAPTNTGGAGIVILDYAIQYYNGTNWVSYGDGYNSRTFATISNLTNGSSYIFRVAAINNVGTGPFSDNSSVVTIAGTPTQPTNVVATPGNKSIWVSWTPPSNDGGLCIKSYKLEYSSNNGSSWIVYNTGTILTHTGVLVTDFRVVNGSSYIFRVSANNGILNSQYSANSAPSIPSPTSPQPPTNVRATALDASVSLSWNAPSDNNGSEIINYVIQQSSNGGSTWTTINSNTGTQTNFIVTNLNNDSLYVFRVAATNNIGTGSFSTQSLPVTPIQGSILFDNSDLDHQISHGLNNAGLDPSFLSLWKAYYLEASARLAKYIKYNNTTIQAIRATGAKNATNTGPWSGTYPIYIRFENNDDGEYVAYAGFDTFSQIHNLAGVAANSISYIIGINIFYKDQLTHSNWVDVFTHELCHALGVGNYWSYNIDTLSGGIPPINNLLSGTSYSNTQLAYNSITELNRQKIPLESKGGVGTLSSHWEDEPRSSTINEPFYYGIWDEVMVGGAPNPDEKFILSRLTLKHLVDLGYEEINPGESEGDPEVNTDRTYNVDNQSTPRIRLNCNCHKQ